MTVVVAICNPIGPGELHLGGDYIAGLTPE